MVTVVIVGVLAAIAYPAYGAFVIKGNRSAAQSHMLALALAQSQYPGRHARLFDRPERAGARPRRRCRDWYTLDRRRRGRPAVDLYHHRHAGRRQQAGSRRRADHQQRRRQDAEDRNGKRPATPRRPASPSSKSWWCVAIVAVLGAIAAPSFTQLIASQRLKSASSDLFSALLRGAQRSDQAQHRSGADAGSGQPVAVRLDHPEPGRQRQQARRTRPAGGRWRSPGRPASCSSPMAASRAPPRRRSNCPSPARRSHAASTST